MRQAPKVVAFAGGVGGAKLAHGLAMLLPAGHLTVVVNVGDDFSHYGLHISPDLDTVMYTLAGIANPATGWGLADESWQFLAMLERYGEAPWFRLGDRDLATHILRTHALAQGETLTQITQRFVEQLDISHHILPVTDDRLATVIETVEEGFLNFQHYFVKYRWQPTVIGLNFEGSDRARLTEAVHHALSEADVLVICPSNPLLSIAPILAVQGARQAIEQRRVPCVTVSPLISGKAVKGPTDKLMREMGLLPTTEGIATYYEGLVDVLVIDRDDHHELAPVQARFPDLSIVHTQTLMRTIADRQTLAHRILNYVSEVTL
jgi:LPPG:FO 2-phospho-L-lactate transferase